MFNIEKKFHSSVISLVSIPEGINATISKDSKLKIFCITLSKVSVSIVIFTNVVLKTASFLQKLLHEIDFALPLPC